MHDVDRAVHSATAHAALGSGLSNKEQEKVSIDTEFSRYETSAGSHKHLRLDAGAAAEVKQGAASRMVARTTGRAASSTISSTTISMPDDRALGDTARLSGHPGIRTTRAHPPRDSCR